MGENSTIEWTNHTFNPWLGCSKVAVGCEHCYAERDMDHRYHKVKWGPQGTRVKTSAENWRKPLKWNSEAQAAGERRRVFCASLADVFEDWQGPIRDSRGNVLTYLHGDPEHMIDGGPVTMDMLRRDLCALIDATPWLDWLLLTKRPENIRRMWPQTKLNRQLNGPGDGLLGSYRWNCWLLTSLATQSDADRNIPELLKCRDLVPVLGVSAEPLLDFVDLTAIPHAGCGQFDALDGRSWDESEVDGKSCSSNGGLDWVIVGGESGPHARPLHPEWAQSLRDQCQAAGVPFFVKQMEVGGKVRHDLEAFPETLRRREFPRVVKRSCDG